MRLPRLPLALPVLLALAACTDRTVEPTGPRSSPHSRAALAAQNAVLSATFTDLGTLPGGTTSEAYGVNDAGVVVGYSRVPSAATIGYAERAFRWQNGTMTDLGTLSTNLERDWARANAINGAGQIVGWSYDPGGYQHAVLWTPAGGPYDLGGAIDGGAGLSIANAINDAGQVVGLGMTTTGGHAHAFLWTPGAPGATTGTKVDLGTLPGGTTSAAAGINEDGVVVGRSEVMTTAGLTTHAFRWTPSAPGAATGTMTDLGTLAGGNRSVATGVNAQGQVVGWSDVATPNGVTPHAVLWTTGAAGGIQDLGTLPTWPCCVNSEAAAINDAGQVVGSDGMSPWAIAWLWTADDGMQDLGPTNGDYPDRAAFAIDESGHVAGAAVGPGSSSRRAALWTYTFVAGGGGPLPITIDVSPGDGTNTIKLKDAKFAQLSVAVITTPGFDAPRLVDPATARLGTTPVAARKNGSLFAERKDVDGDGDADLVLHFERARMIANGDLTTATTSLVLHARLTDGTEVEGQDAVRVINK